jgi:hypothetical protein
MPCLLINEKLHKRVKADGVAKLLKDPKNAEIAFPRSTLFDMPAAAAAPAIEKTSDIREMKEA